MRKSLLLTLFLTAAATLCAKEISPQQAMAAARDFMNSERRTKVAPANIKTSGDAEEVKPYYVFNTDGHHGFVIISGDDRVRKILGYSDTGSIDPDNLPPQLKALLSEFGKRIQSLPDTPHASWFKAPASDADVEEILIPTANWGQGFPFNSDCPIIDGEPALTGCVATAMAIVMKHHNWPETYDWKAMPMNTDADPIDYEKDSPELARLMHEAGEAVFMEYSPIESGAYLDWIGHRMQNVFHYSPDCQYLGWENFEFEQWNDMLKRDLDKGNPVIYDGYGTGGHHAFVVDGYAGEDYHVNWGWNGMANGFFALMDLTPFEGENFSEHQGMVINIEPDHAMGDYSECFVDFGYLWATGTTRMTAEMNVSVCDIEKGKPFHLFNSLISVPAGFEGQVGVAIVDKDDNIKEVLKSHYVSSYQSWNNVYATTNTAIRYYDLTPTCDIEPTDRLQLVAKHDTDEKFKLMLGTLEWPSSRPVIGNVPLTAKVTFSIAEGTSCDYVKEGLEDYVKTLATGKTEENFYIGEFLSLRYAKTDPEGTDPLHMVLHGNFFGGDTETWTGHQPAGYPFGIYAAENSVEISLLHLVDEAIHLEKGGTLKDHIDPDSAINIANLTVTGEMNASDFWFIRDNCGSLQSLDIGEVTIKEYTGGDGEWVPDGMSHPANTIPYLAIPGLIYLEKLTLPENLEAIEGFSLQNLKLKSLRIPSGVKSIGWDAFYGNEGLEAIEALNPDGIEIESTPFDSTLCPENGVLFVPEGATQAYSEANIWKDFGRIIEGNMPDPLKPMVTIDNVTYECYIDEAKIIGWEGEPVNIVIPEKLSINGVSYTVNAIGNDAFNQCMTLETFEMPNSIKAIGYNAFFWCINLRNIKISDNVEEILYSTFDGCEKLEEFTIGPNIKSLGSRALFGTGIKSIFIPKTLLPNSPDSPFGENLNLEAYTVEEGNPIYKAIDGILYRITDKGHSLEAVPGKLTGTVEIPDVCKDVMKNAFNGSNISNLIFNEGLESLSSQSIAAATGLKHISIPKSVRIYEDAIQECYNLESVTFRGNIETYGSIFHYCPYLQHIYIDSEEEEEISLEGLFADDYENLNVFSPLIGKNFLYSGKHSIFVPGGCGALFEGNEPAEITELWKYAISRENNYIAIIPLFDELSIDRITINGRVTEPIVAGSSCYRIEEDNTSASMMVAAEADDNTAGLDVKVDYTLHGRQKLSTHYTKEFNADIADTTEDIMTGTNQIGNEFNDGLDVYSIDGDLIHKGADKTVIGNLDSGVYIIRSGGKTIKVMITG